MIGTDKNGASAIPNAIMGILLTGAPADIGDGTTPGNNLISGNTGDGIYATGSDVSGTTIIGNNMGVTALGGSLPNGTGIELVNGATIQIAQNYIANYASDSIVISSTSSANGSYNCFVHNTGGLYNSNSVATADFTNNWWGSATGSSGTGPGTGDPVSTYVNYSPWLTSPAAACAPKASLSSPSLNFGDQPIGATSAIQSVTLQNAGMASLNFSSITPPASFNVDASSTCVVSTSVAVNATCTLALTFSPTALGSAGGNVVMTSDASNSPANLAVSGTGVSTQLLLSPANGGFMNNKGASFDWNDVPGAAAYQIQIARNNTFKTLVKTATVGSSNYAVPGSLPAAILYWRVRVETGSVWGAWSAPWSYTSIPQPAGPVLTAPPPNALISNYTPTLTWKTAKPPAGKAIDHYELQIATDTSFSVPVISLPGLSYTPGSPLASNTKYFWRVRAYNTAGTYSAWSAVRVFRTTMVAPTLNPVAGSSGSLKPVFSWVAVPGAKSYTIQVSKNAIFTKLVRNATVKTTTAYAVTVNLPIGTLYWRVRANGANTSLWSSSTVTIPLP